MSNEEVDRKIAFIIEQQAQFAADIHQLREVQGQTDQVVARLANVTLEGFKDVNAKINALGFPNHSHRSASPHGHQHGATDNRGRSLFQRKSRTVIVFLRRAIDA